MAECLIKQTVCKTAGEKRPWGFNFALFFARKWTRSTPFAAAVAVRPSKEGLQTGYEYRSSGGVSGAAEPRWPTAKDIAKGVTTVKDGSITWTAQAISFDSLFERIQTKAWTVPAGIVFDEAAVVDEPAQQSSGGQWSSGTAGESFDASLLIETTQGNEYEARLTIEVHEDT